MLIKLLKTFLYSILVLIFFWGVAVLLGPGILKYVAQKYYGENISLVGLKVSPRLEIYASRVELNNVFLPNLGVVSGFVRAASLSLNNFSDGKLFLEFSTGPVEIYNFGKIDNTSAILSIDQFYPLDKLGLDVRLKNVDVQNKVFLESFKGGGVFDLNSKNLNEIEFEIGGISNNFIEKLFVKTASGEIARFDASKPFDQSLSSFVIVLEHISSSNKTFDVDKISLNGDLDVNDQKLDVGISNLKLMGESVASYINFQRNGEGLIRDRVGVVSYKANGIGLEKIEQIPFLVTIGQVAGAVDFYDPGNISLTARGKFDKFDLISGSQFIADLSDSEFDLGLRLNSDREGITVKTNYALNVAVDPTVAIRGKLTFKSSDRSITRCAVSGCKVSDLVLNYDFSAGGSSLVGYSKCNSEDCSFANSIHSIKTSDTQKLFSALVESGVFSPLALIFAQSQVQMGIEIGAGHELKF